MILTAKQLLSNLPNKQSIKGYMFRLIQGLLSNQQRLAALAVCQCAPSEGTALKGRGGMCVCGGVLFQSVWDLGPTEGL